MIKNHNRGMGAQKKEPIFIRGEDSKQCFTKEVVSTCFLHKHGFDRQKKLGKIYCTVREG